MKKTLLLLLGGAACFTILTGCSAAGQVVETLKGDFQEVLNLNFGEILDFVGGYVPQLVDGGLPQPKFSEALAADLPLELNTVTIDGSTLNCRVAHLVVLERETNEKRQTDAATCQVILEGDGVSASYQCTLYYTYTQNGGWGLDDWRLNQDTVAISVDDGVLTEQLSQQTAGELEASYGEGSVTYLSSQWDGTTNTCTQSFQINGSNGVLLTQGTVVTSCALELDLDKGLYYTWNTGVDDSQVIRGADLTNTTWLCSGTVDGREGAIAFHVDDFQMETGQVTVTGVTETKTEGGYTSNFSFSGSTVSWFNGENGSVTFTLESGNQTWECCFAADKQWVRMSGSYLDELTETTMPADGNLREILYQEAAEREAQEKNRLEYEASETGQSYSASNGAVVYVQRVSYPKFTGDKASPINEAVEAAIKSYLAAPNQATDTASLDARAAEAAGEGSNLSLPISDELKITVEYNKNGYLSLLYTTITRSSSGAASYSYEGESYDLNTGLEMAYTQFISAGSTQLGQLLVDYGGGTFPYSAAAATSYVKAVTLGNKGLNFYLADEGGQALLVSIPYSEAAYTKDPTETRTDLDSTGTEY